MSEATFTFRVEEELKAAFAEAAKHEDQTAAQLLRRFMREYVKDRQEKAEHDAWFRRQVQTGIESADAGNLFPHEEVEAKFARRRAETLGKLGENGA